MPPHPTLSSYLVRPSISPRRQPQWPGFRTRMVAIRRASRGIAPKTLVTLALWGILGGIVSVVTTPHTLPGQAALAIPSIAPPITGSASNPATLAAVSHAPTLPGGPSGQLMPPGTMAAPKTYANGYTAGQCTWYVAGRRQIPGNWGNANTWYWHATNSGWAVGTTPAVAAIAWTGAGPYGHVALVEQVSADGKRVQVSEMNYYGPYHTDTRWTAATAFKYIY